MRVPWMQWCDTIPPRDCLQGNRKSIHILHHTKHHKGKSRTNQNKHTKLAAMPVPVKCIAAYPSNVNCKLRPRIL